MTHTKYDLKYEEKTVCQDKMQDEFFFGFTFFSRRKKGEEIPPSPNLPPTFPQLSSKWNGFCIA